MVPIETCSGLELEFRLIKKATKSYPQKLLKILKTVLLGHIWNICYLWLVTKGKIILHNFNLLLPPVIQKETGGS